MKPRRLRVPNWTRGVTLVELMIVIVVLGILAALTGPSVRRTMERTNARGVAREVANTLRTARNQAMSRGEALLVVITPASGAARGSLVIQRSPDVDASTPERDPVRNCRQTGLTAAWTEVYTYSLDGASGETAIREISPAAATTLCFSPDGRIVTPGTGQATTPDATMACSGENLVLVAADLSANPGAEKTCAGTTDERELSHLYRVTVSYNGSIKVDQ